MKNQTVTFLVSFIATFAVAVGLYYLLHGEVMILTSLVVAAFVAVGVIFWNWRSSKSREKSNGSSS